MIFIVLSSLETVHDTVQYRYCIVSLLYRLLRIRLKCQNPSLSYLRERERERERERVHYKCTLYVLLLKGKAVPLQFGSDPEGSRKLRFPDYMTTAQDGVKVVSLTHRPPLHPGNNPGTQFC
jgi:hypothetical protein